jgi:hypothetical protein
MVQRIAEVELSDAIVLSPENKTKITEKESTAEHSASGKEM